MKAGMTDRTSALHEVARSLRQACRQIAGIPDYERYLDHMRSEHPADPVLSRRDFFAQAVARKYGRGSTRCC